MYYRKIIRITAEDSPNVKLGILQRQRGIKPTNTIVLPGVLTYEEYLMRRRIWDAVRQCVGLDAKFYVGAELLLFPQEWLNRANKLAVTRRPRGSTVYMGIDPAEGGDKSCWALSDDYGLFKLVSIKTPDTTHVIDNTVGLIREFSIRPENVCMDRGGGGKQHADRLRQLGFNIRTIAFGEPVAPPPKRMRTVKPYEQRVDAVEEKYVYFNRRSQLYGEFSILLDPAETGAALGLKDFEGWAIPTGGLFDELRRQLAPIPKTWDKSGEGRLKLLPKNNSEDPTDNRTLVALIGNSPDEADATVLSAHAKLHKPGMTTAGGWC